MQQSVSVDESSCGASERLAAMMERERTAYARRDYLRPRGDDPSSHVNVVITESDRARIVDWCYRVVDRLKLSRETVAVAIDAADRFLATPCPAARDMLADRVEFQLLAMASLYTSIKLGARASVGSDAFAAMSHGAYTIEEFEATELLLLEGLGWRMCAPTAVMAAHLILSIIAPQVCLDGRAWGGIIDEVLHQAECAVRDYPLSLRRASDVAMAAVLNALDVLSDGGERRAVLDALLRVLVDMYESPMDLAAVGERLRQVVRDNDALADDDASAATRGTTARSLGCEGDERVRSPSSPRQVATFVCRGESTLC